MKISNGGWAAPIPETDHVEFMELFNADSEAAMPSIAHAGSMMSLMRLQVVLKTQADKTAASTKYWQH